MNIVQMGYVNSIKPHDEGYTIYWKGGKNTYSKSEDVSLFEVGDLVYLTTHGKWLKAYKSQYIGE